MQSQPVGFAGRLLSVAREADPLYLPPAIVLAPSPALVAQRPLVAIMPPAPRSWNKWTPSLATTLLSLAALGTSAALALWQSDNSSAAITYSTIACMTGAVLATQTLQTSWTRANDSTQRMVEAASIAAARTVEEVLPNLTQTVIEATAQTSQAVAHSLEDASHHINQTLEVATQSVVRVIHQLAKATGVILGTVAALYVLGCLGAPLLLGVAAGQGNGMLAGLLGIWSMSMVAVGWLVPRNVL